MIEKEQSSMSSFGDSGVVLIADSGSTKTHWCVVDRGIVEKEVFTDGINPFYQSVQDVIALLH